MEDMGHHYTPLQRAIEQDEGVQAHHTPMIEQGAASVINSSTVASIRPRPFAICAQPKGAIRSRTPNVSPSATPAPHQGKRLTSGPYRRRAGESST
jgi:hypothetical protein